MPQKFLEQLTSEWYGYQGYFIRRNVNVGKRPQGGYECELDIVAFHPSKNSLVHIEPSSNADSWAIREKRFKRKFEAGRKYIPSLWRGLKLPAEIDQIALLIFASKKNHPAVGGGRVLLASDLLAEISSGLKRQSIYSNAIPEHFLILRSLQIVSEYRKEVFGILFPGKASCASP